MRVRKVLTAASLGLAFVPAALAVLFLWKGVSLRSRLAAMSAAERAEWIDICRTPDMDCVANPSRWFFPALVFGLASIALIVFARVARRSAA